jgi:hypothetical protein
LPGAMSKEPEDRKDEQEPENAEPRAEEDAEDEAAAKDEADADEADADEADEGEDAEDEDESAPEGEGDENGDGEDEAKAPKAPAAPKAAAKPGAAKPAAGAKKKSLKPRSGGVRATPPAKRSRIPNILLYALLIGGIALAFAFLGQQDGGGGDETHQPTWKEGDLVDVSITLVTTDVKDLACSSDEVVKDKHCGFDDKRKPHPKGNDVRTDPNVLQPYTTTDNARIQLLAAGMWTSPELKAKLDAENWNNPSPRFNVECKAKVEGRMKEAGVRWKPEPDGGWLAGPAKDWYVVGLQDCKIRATHNLAPAKPKP